MEKPRTSLKSLGLGAVMAAAMAGAGAFQAGAHIANRGLHYVGFGKKQWKHSNTKYIARDPVVRNPKIAAQMNAMHEQIDTARAGRVVHKQEANPNSITSKQWGSGRTRHVIRVALGIDFTPFKLRTAR